MTFTSPVFLAFVVVAALVVLPLRGTARRAAILIASLVFVGSYVADPLAIVPLAGFIAAGYGAVWLAAGGRGRHGVGLLVAVTVALFVWLKKYPFVGFLPGLPFTYTMIGASYILFRVLHVVLEVADGALERPRPLAFLTYLLFFPAFLSGPINRYQPFVKELAQPAEMDGNAGRRTLFRLLLGFLKVAVIGEVLKLTHGIVDERLVLAMQGDGALVPAFYYALAAPLYFLFLYANFSGYMDMAIAIARLFGIILPENFNKPFHAANFQDFWSRWHMTLSDWFKVYAFNPLLKRLMRWFPARAAEPYLGVATLFVIFLTLGMWHGASWEFMLCGLLFASGVAANKLYQVEMIRRLGKKPFRALTARPLYVWAARGLTLAWFAVCLTTFWRPVAGIGALTLQMGIGGVALALGAMTWGFAVATWLLQRVEHAMIAPAAARTVAPAWHVAAMAAMVLVLAFAVPMLNASSDFVYKAF